jgi:ParB family transcriptional regulator, chromosome partitioning protein
MDKAPRRLGRGLSSLISVPDEPSPPHVDAEQQTPRAAALLIEVGQIRPNPFQPRRDLPPEQLKSLADSIRKNGVLQPIVLRQKGPNLYELIAGERRWRASQMAGLGAIPAVVRDASDEQMLEIALVENIFREDLNAIDRALAYRRYRDEFDLTAEDVASRLGEDRSTVANYLRLLELPSEVKDYVAAGKLSMGHARCLLAIRSPGDLVRLAQQAIEQGLSVRTLEKLVRERVEARAAASKPSAVAEDKRPQIRNLEQAFVRAIGTKVEIHESRRKGSGKIVIHYYSLDDFDRISEQLGVEGQ